LHFDSEVCCLSPDGATIATAAPSGVAFIPISAEVLGGGVIDASRTNTCDERATTISFSPDGRSLAAFVGAGGDVRVLSVDGVIDRWTTSAIPPRIDSEGRLIIVPTLRDRLLCVPPSGRGARTWFQHYGRSTTPARIQLPSRPGMKRGDNVVVLSRIEPSRPLGIYRIVSGPRWDDPPSIADAPATFDCEQAFSFPPVVGDVVRAEVRPTLARLSTAEEDSTHDGGHRAILEAVSEIYAGDRAVLERAFSLLGPVRPMAHRVERRDTSSPTQRDSVNDEDEPKTRRPNANVSAASSPSTLPELRKLELIEEAGGRYASLLSRVDFAMVATRSARIISARATLTSRETATVDFKGDGWVAMRRELPLEAYPVLAEAACGGSFDFDGVSYSFPTPLEIAHNPFRLGTRSPREPAFPLIETISCADSISSVLTMEWFAEWKRRISAETDVFDVDELRARLALSQTFSSVADRRQFSLQVEIPLTVAVVRVDREGVSLTLAIDVPVAILVVRLKLRNDNTQETNEYKIGVADRLFTCTWSSRTPESATRCLFSYKIVKDDDVLLEGRADVLAPIEKPHDIEPRDRRPLPVTRVFADEPPRPSGELLGAKVGQWRLSRLIGAGGSGAVYVGENELTRHRMAVKVVIVDEGGSFERWKRELRAANEVGHPILVPFHDSSFDHEHGVAFATMEALVGEDLWSRLRRGPMPSNEVLDLMTRLLEGLAACHERGIAHRDLHPGNIFLETTSSGSVRVRLLDFGLCAVVGRPRVTRSTTGVGHMLYACPTQLIGAADAGHAQGDVWSVGVVLYECLTGRHPFECDNDAGAVIRAATQPHVAAVERGVDPELSALIDECLQKVPESRPGDAGALLVKLQAIAQRRVG
jgi:hypothetical protein